MNRLREHISSWAPGRKIGSHFCAFIAGAIVGVLSWLIPLLAFVAWVARSFKLLAWAGAVTALAAAVATANPPDAAARAALVHLSQLPEETRCYSRYLLLPADRKARAEQIVAANYMANAISRTANISRLVELPGGLLWMNLAQFATDKHTLTELQNAWEALAVEDKYFHLRTQYAVKGVITTGTIDGGWVDPAVAVSLRKLSGSDGAIVRADYFVAASSRAPLYYDFAGVKKTEGEFLASLGVDRVQQNELKALKASNLIRSKITDKERRIVLMVSPLGGVYETQDILVESGDHNPFRNPLNVYGKEGPQVFKHDASEWFAAKPNKMFLTALYDGKGRRQESVPDKIAKDAHAKDGIVTPIVSCIRCHEREGFAGLQPFTDDQFPLLSGKASAVASKLPEVAQRLGEVYQPQRMIRSIARDREDYTLAVAQATGVAPGEAAKALSNVYANFTDDTVSLAKAASEAGVSVETLAIKAASSNDPIVRLLLSGKAVKRKTFETSWPEIIYAAWDIKKDIKQ